MEQKPLVSIVVPVYNVEKYLPHCIESLLSQTLRQIEVICVNDCSPDHSLEILRKYAEKDERLIILSLPENRRQGGARNAGIRMAKGEYIGFVDSDDWVDKSMYERLYEVAKAEGADVVTSDYYEFFSDGDIRYVSFASELNFTEDYDQRARLLISSGCRLWASIFKKKLFFDNQLFFPENVIYEDNAVGIPLFLKANRFVKVDEAFYYYRCSNSSTTRSYNNPHFFDRMETSLLFLENLKRLGLYEKYKSDIDISFIKLFYVWTSIGALTKFRPPEKRKLEEIRVCMRSVLPDFKKNEFFRQKISRKHRFILYLIHDCGPLGVETFLFFHKMKSLCLGK